MLGTVLCLPPAACKQWGDAVAALPPGQLRHVAKDPGGCRVLEAYLEVGAARPCLVDVRRLMGPRALCMQRLPPPSHNPLTSHLASTQTTHLQGPGAPSKKRKALLQGLAGSWGEVAMGGSGNNFVEKCYALGVSVATAWPPSSACLCSSPPLPACLPAAVAAALGCGWAAASVWAGPRWDGLGWAGQSSGGTSTAPASTPPDAAALHPAAPRPYRCTAPPCCALPPHRRPQRRRPLRWSWPPRSPAWWPRTEGRCCCDGAAGDQGGWKGEKGGGHVACCWTHAPVCSP